MIFRLRLAGVTPSYIGGASLSPEAVIQRPAPSRLEGAVFSKGDSDAPSVGPLSLCTSQRRPRPRDGSPPQSQQECVHVLPVDLPVLDNLDLEGPMIRVLACLFSPRASRFQGPCTGQQVSELCCVRGLVTFPHMHWREKVSTLRPRGIMPLRTRAFRAAQRGSRAWVPSAPSVFCLPGVLGQGSPAAELPGARGRPHRGGPVVTGVASASPRAPPLPPPRKMSRRRAARSRRGTTSPPTLTTATQNPGFRASCWRPHRGRCPRLTGVSFLISVFLTPGEIKQFFGETRVGTFGGTKSWVRSRF